MTTDAREAALRPFAKPGRGYWVVVLALGLVVLAGIAAWVVQLRRGMAVSGFNDHAFWAIDLANVVTFIGVSYGGAVVSAMLRLTGATWRAPLTRLAEGTALVTVLIGAAFIIPHLGRPDRIWELVTRPNLSAPVFWDFVAISTYAAATLVFFVLPLVPDTAALRDGDTTRLGRRRTLLYTLLSRGWVGAPHQRRVLAGALGVVSIMIIPLAVSVHSVLAWAFSLTSRPGWHESIWAPYFVVAALYSGVALVILVVAGFRRGYHLEAFITERHIVRLGFIMAAFSAGYLYLTFADILPSAYVGERADAEVLTHLLIGHVAVWFWLFVVAAGVVPLLIVALPWTRNVVGIVIAAALVAPAMWVKRMLMVVDPANHDTVTGSLGGYHFTWVAVTITLAGVAAVPLLLMLLFRVVPLLSLDEMQEAEAATGQPRGEPVVAAGPLRDSGSAGVLLLVAALGLGLGLLAAAPARATPPQGTPTLTVTGIQGDGMVQLTARLTGPDGRPQAKAGVTFGLITTVFGAQGRLVTLASVPTDNIGVARFVYRPTVTGPQEFVATYSPASGAQQVRSSTTLTVTVARSAYHPAPPRPLAGLGRDLIGVLFTLVALVWITLVAQVVRIRRACRVVPEEAPSSR
jgi:molybdopterin-containing oxidoreductase family membrane subunit